MQSTIYPILNTFMYWMLLARKLVQLSRMMKKNTYSMGRDRSPRPYMKNLFKPREGEDFELSKAYITKNTKRPSITGIQLIRDKQGNRLGFLGVDYDLRELPRDDTMYEEPRQWRQIKGDPAIRSGLFLQQRAESQMDKKLSDVMTILEEPDA